MIGIVTSDIFYKHDTKEHPENLKRLDAIFSYPKNIEILKGFEKFISNKIDMDLLYKVHTQEYVSYVKDFCKNGGGRIDDDTPLCTESYEVALYSAGGVIDAVDLVFSNQLKKVFCISRPPGHHAISNSSMGFCLFNNLAIGAKYALEKYKLKKILILDWDAHHGNGTEQIFYESDNVLTVSWHNHPFWPYTGEIGMIGKDKGLGYNLNIPIPDNFTDEVYIETFENIVIPIAKRYKPDLIMVANGYDAHYKDTLANLSTTTPLYHYLTKRTIELSEELCNGKLVITLEGGYNLEVIPECIYNTFNVLKNPEAKNLETLAKEKDDNKIIIKDLIERLAILHKL